MSILRTYWRRWRVKYRLQPIFDRLLGPLHLKVEVKLGDDYLPRRRKQNLTLDEYVTIYGKDAVENRRFYSFGAGGWFHDAWTSVDHYMTAPEYGGAYIDWDVATLRPFPVESGTASCTHTQHMIEHLTDAEVEFMFRESYRILKPGAVFRVAAPDARTAYDMWRRNDPIFFRDMEPLTPTQVMVCFGASQLIVGKDQKGRPRLSDAEIKALFDAKGFAGAWDTLSGMCEVTKPRVDPFNHTSWWSAEKAGALLRRVGFSEIFVNGPGQSISPTMRDRRYFDTNQPHLTFQVDAVK